MQYGVLGPLEISEDGRSVEVRGARQRALLATLLLNRNRAVSVDSLVDALWEDSPPETAAKAVQVHVSRLRALLGKDRLLTRPPGYMLRVAEGELDIEQFDRLREQGHFAEALALWRGPPLGEFSRAAFAQPEIARLQELWLVCREEQIDADLAAGRASAVVGELEALLAQHPLRQRLRGQLMLALYRSGREAEALDVYRAGRRQLVDELGIEPRRELRDLQQAILRQDPALELAGEQAAAIDVTPRGAFVGRESELLALRGGLDEALAGRGRLFLLVGEPGIGKSRLAEEITRGARARGAHVLVGRCWEAGGAPPYWPWVQSLRAYVRTTEASTSRKQLDANASDLVQLLPELRELVPDIAELPTLDSEGARFRLFESIASFLRAAAAARPLVLFLDDLHAADEPSLLLLRFVARELGTSHILVVGACRDVDPTPSDSMTTTITELAREPVARIIALHGLSEADIARFVELTASEPGTDELVAALCEETSGNPLFVGEIVRLLATDGRLRQGERRFAIPQGVRDVIAQRLRHLSERCERILVLASVLGREFALDALARLSDVSADELLDTLDEAMAARVVADVPGAPGRLRFVHVLIRDAVYDGLTTPRRIQLHRLALHALESLYDKDSGPHLAELAHHAAHGRDLERGPDYARRAAEYALAQLAYEEAARLCETALEALEHAISPPADVLAELLIRLGDAQARGGDGPASRATFLRAVDIARASGLTDALGRAAVGYGGHDLWGPRAEAEPEFVGLLEEALAACPLGDNALRAQLLSRLACALRGSVDRARPAELAHSAVEIASRLGDSWTLLGALGAQLVATQGPDTIADAAAGQREFVRRAEELRDLGYAYHGHEFLLQTAWVVGDREAIGPAVEETTSAAKQLRQPARDYYVATYHALTAVVEGRLDVAGTLVEAAYELGQRAESWIAASVYRLQTFLQRTLRGDVSGCETELERSLDELPPYAMLECALAHAYMQLGRRHDAMFLLEERVRDDVGGLSRDENWLVSMCLLADVCVEFGADGHARTLHRLLSPFSSLNAVSHWELHLGSVARYVGRLATLLDQLDEAATCFEQAIQMNERMLTVPWLAAAQLDYGSLLLRRDAPGDTSRAATLLDQARATFVQLGMEAYAGRCSAAQAGA